MATDYQRDECESCHAGVIWTVTTNAIPMPVDYEPAEGGTLKLERRGGRVLSSVVKPTLAFGRTDLRKSHFATCPNAAQHRKRKQP